MGRLIFGILGLAAGIGAGLALGWWFPINVPPTDPAALDPMWQADYILMTAQAYSLDGDLGMAQRRLAELDTPDAGALVAAHGQQAIVQDMPPEDIGRLARLAAALGTRTPELEPYLEK